jgi:hypothetical protein
MEFPNWAVLLVLIIMLIVFSDQVCYLLDSVKTAVVSAIGGEPENMKTASGAIIDDDALLGALRRQQPVHDVHHGGMGKAEHMEATPTLPPGQVSDVLTVLGYTGEQPWHEVIKATELDPSTFVNHNEFIRDVRRFSSGANFTSVTDDNTNSAFSNFIGLRRPTHVPIGATARQQPDIDQTVLMRNSRFAFRNGPDFSANPDSPDDSE